eukprot:1155229-Pelagomonas_calceolata.AAC.4
MHRSDMQCFLLVRIDLTFFTASANLPAEGNANVASLPVEGKTAFCMHHNFAKLPVEIRPRPRAWDLPGSCLSRPPCTQSLQEIVEAAYPTSFAQSSLRSLPTPRDSTGKSVWPSLECTVKSLHAHVYGAQ